MKKYIRKSIVGSKISLPDLSKIIEHAYASPLCIISANRSENTGEENIKNDKLLEAWIAGLYDYAVVEGAWENADGNIGNEPSFIMIGPEYGLDRNDRFIDDCKKMCAKFNQDAVLYISATEDISQLTDKMLKDRYDAYAVFSDPDYIEDEDYFTKNLYTDYDQEKEKSEILKRGYPTAIYQLHGEYKDRNWNTIQEYNNVIPEKIGAFFTALARMNGANLVSFQASVSALRAKMQFKTQQSVMRYRHDILASEDYTTLDRYIANQTIQDRQDSLDGELYNKIVGID